MAISGTTPAALENVTRRLHSLVDLAHHAAHRAIEDYPPTSYPAKAAGIRSGLATALDDAITAIDAEIVNLKAIQTDITAAVV